MEIHIEGNLQHLSHSSAIVSVILRLAILILPLILVYKGSFLASGMRVVNSFTLAEKREILSVDA